MRIQYSLQFPFPDLPKTYEVRYEKAECAGYMVVEADPFSLTLTWHKNRVLSVVGESSLLLQMSCDRCLQNVTVPVTFSIEEELHTDDCTGADGEEVFCLQDEEFLDADSLIEPFVSMNVPMKVLCRKDCKGICVRCGANLNDGPCGCQKTEAPTKMADALMKALQNTKLD